MSRALLLLLVLTVGCTGTVSSFFWNPPGQNTARFDSVHFGDHTEAFRTNTPLSTRLRDYRGHSSPENTNRL